VRKQESKVKRVQQERKVDIKRKKMLDNNNNNGNTNSFFYLFIYFKIIQDFQIIKGFQRGFAIIVK
jgi:hypothetical protein